MQIQPQLLIMNELLSGRLFRIPEYQRAYAWGKQQRADLFSDIYRVRTAGDDHFLATMVGLLQPEKMRIVADEFVVVEVVDGQQRLTTLVILLKAIQKSLDPKNKIEAKLRHELGELLVKGDELSLLLLQTNHDTSRIFADYIREGATPNEDAQTLADQNLTDAIKECEEFVSEWKNSRATLIDLIAIIRNRLYAVFYSVNDEGMVYRVFEVLNSRGLDVDSMDKFKSQLMGLIFEHAKDGGRREAIEELHRIWQDIYRTIGKQKQLTRETIRFAGTLRAQAAPPKPLDEAKSVQRLIDLAGKKPKQIVDCAKSFREIVKAENRLLEEHSWRAVTEIQQARITAVAILLRDFSANERSKILGRLERVSFRIYGLNDQRTNRMVGDYTRLAWSSINESLDAAEIMLRLSKIGQKFPIEKVMAEFDPTDCYTGWGEELRYFFYRYDRHLALEHGEKLNERQWNKIWLEEPAKSIEHVKPQSSGVSFMHHLGNLTMLTPGVNSSLGGKDPAKKVEAYERSGLLSTIEVAKLIRKGKWDRAAVEQRAEKLLAWAETEWRD